MSDEPVQLEVAIARWREELLRRAGCPARLARLYAGDADLDATAMVRLMRRGCPAALAARIVAPLDRPVA